MQKNNVFKLAIIFLLTLVVSTATVIPAANVRANANANEPVSYTHLTLPTKA